MASGIGDKETTSPSPRLSQVFLKHMKKSLTNLSLASYFLGMACAITVKWVELSGVAVPLAASNLAAFAFTLFFSLQVFGSIFYLATFSILSLRKKDSTETALALLEKTGKWNKAIGIVFRFGIPITLAAAGHTLYAVMLVIAIISTLTLGALARDEAKEICREVADQT